MRKSNDLVSTETETHVIEVSEGCLTIGTKHFPDNSVSLTPEETDEVLKMLLWWKEGAASTTREKETYHP